MKTVNYLTLLLVLFISNVYGANLYVAKNGNDANTGTLASPYLTIQKASSVAVSGDVVFVRAGVYRELVEIFSNGVTYQPYLSESVTVNGTDLMLSWSAAGGSTYQTQMSWNMDNWGTNQVFSDGKMLELARWPNQTSTDIVMPSNASAEAVTANGNNITIYDMEFNEPNGRWVGAKIWINLARVGYDGQGWTGTVTSTNQAAKTITLNFSNIYNAPPRLGDRPWGLGITTEYFLFDPTALGVNSTGGVNNLLSNGEWWKAGNTLYVKTPNGAAPSASATGVNVIEAKRRHFGFFPNVSNKSNYIIKDFNLFACAISTDRNAKINTTIAEDAQNIMIDGIKAKYPSHQTVMSGNWQAEHDGWSGFVVSGRNNTIKNCTLQYSATSALSIQGFGIKVLNNTIRDANYFCSNAGALNTGRICKDSEIAYNTIFNTTIMGINFKKSENSDINIRDRFRIHHNTLYDFMRRSGDSGAIDMVGQDGKWLRIDHNLIYNTTPTIGFMIHGIYLDYGGGPGINEGHYTVDHNVVYNVPAPLLLNQTDDVNIFNNVFIENKDSRPIEGRTSGLRVKMYNNIFSKPLALSSTNLFLADIKTNIYNARGLVPNTLFSNMAGNNFDLIATAITAINQGTLTNGYDINVVGVPDLGVKEYTASTDVIAPSVPINFSSNNILPSSFNVAWTTSTDNVGAAYYEVFVNGVYYASRPTNAITIIGLVPMTTYTITVRAVDAAGNRSAISAGYNVTTTAATNLAIQGTGYRWFGNASATNNSNRVLAGGINDGDLVSTVRLNGGANDGNWRWQSAGIIFNNAQNEINNVNFIQGDVNAQRNSCFTNWISLQYTKDGTTWTESNWDVEPVYPYGNSAAGKTYSFSGPAIVGLKGIRITGILNSDSSKEAGIKEVRAYNGTVVVSPYITANEKFEYAAGNLDSRNGGSGWLGPWMVDGGVSVEAGDLTNVAGSPAGKARFVASDPQATRNLNSVYTDDLGKVYWIDFSMQGSKKAPNFDLTGNDDSISIDLAGITLLNNEEQKGYMGKSNNFGVGFGDASTINNSLYRANHYLVKIVMSGDTNREMAYMWRNYSGTIAPPNTSANLTSAFGVSGKLGNFNRIRLSAIASAIGTTPDVAIDNIRVSETFAPITTSTRGSSSSQNASLLVYPNPASSGILNVVTQSDGIKSISVISITGVRVIDMDVKGANTKAGVNIESLPKGIYIIEVTTTTSIIRKQVVIN